MRSATFYDFPESPNSYKIRLLLSLLDRTMRVIKMAGYKGATRNEEFTFLPESNAILFALARDTEYCPFNRKEQYDILRWMFFEQNRIEATIGTARYQLTQLKKKDRNTAFVEELQKRAKVALQVMEDHLASHEYFAGEHFTIADIALYAYTHVADEAGVPLADFPKIRDWITRVEERERFIPFTY